MLLIDVAPVSGGSGIALLFLLVVVLVVLLFIAAAAAGTIFYFVRRRRKTETLAPLPNQPQFTASLKHESDAEP